MKLPEPNLKPSFNMTRTSHVVLTVKDLEASRAFYENLVGLVVSDEDRDTLYFRGYGEHSHHSLVLKRTTGALHCERLGMRVFTEEDLDRAKFHFERAQLPTAWVEVPEQGRTLHVTDANGIPLELCATMTTRPRLYMEWENFKGGAPQQLDHYQVIVPDVMAASEFYMDMGFRIAEYVVVGDDVTATFLFRKYGPFDIVLFSGPGPRIHHFAYSVPETGDVLRACDLAGNLGYGSRVERGPGRHGPGGAFYVYFRDPDGHRVELFTNHYQTIDIELEPYRWGPAEMRNGWGLPAQRAWHEEATSFAGLATRPPRVKTDPVTLEKYLAQLTPA